MAVDPTNECERYTYVTAAERLGTNPFSIRASAHIGIVKTIREGARTYLSAEEVEKWEKFFITINPPFIWLNHSVTCRANRLPTVTLSVAARMLRIDPMTVSRWAKLGLVPFYPDSFSRSTKRCHKAMPVKYIEGLRRCMLGVRPTQTVARAYLEECQNIQKVI
jgi:hypothetical protein